MSDELVVNDKQAMSALKMHGNKIVWAVILVLVGYFGWDFYQKNYAKIDTVAADSYTLITEKNNEFTHQTDKETTAKNQEALFADIDELVVNHPKSAYAWQALMIKARHQSDNGQHTKASATLRQASQMNLDDEGLTAITKLRLGQSLMAEGSIDEALTLGDIYVLKNDDENAKQAYQLAWNELSERGEIRSLLNLKMQALGMTPTTITPKHQVVATPDADASTAHNAQEDNVSKMSSDDAGANKTAQVHER